MRHKFALRMITSEFPGLRRLSRNGMKGADVEVLAGTIPMMPRQLFADYHFHPNFDFSSKRKIHKRAKQPAW